MVRLKTGSKDVLLVEEHGQRTNILINGVQAKSLPTAVGASLVHVAQH
jgi:hypothetical protein